MTNRLGFLLIIVSFIGAYWTFRKIKKSQLQIEDSLFWLFTAAGLFILSIFPNIASWCSKLIGVQSPSNFIFLVMIFLLLLKVFQLTLKLSQVENKLRSLTQEVGIRDKKINDLITELQKGE